MRITSSPSTPRCVALEHVPISSITANPQNAREHSRVQVRQIARSIEAFGFNAPLLVDRDLKLVAGHGRLMALQSLGWKDAPIVRLEHLSAEQARAYAIADNRLTDASKFNSRQLALHMQILSGLELDFDLEATGFHMGEIDLMIEELTLDGGVTTASPDGDDRPIDPAPPVTKPGDLWRLGAHRLYCGSALEARSYERLLEHLPLIQGHIQGHSLRRRRSWRTRSG